MSLGRLEKQRGHLVEPPQRIFAIAGYALAHFVEGFLPIGVRLGIEFVGQADELLFERDGAEVAMRQGQILGDDVVDGKACAGVPFAHKGVSRIAVGPHQFGPQYAVADVRLVAHAVNRRGVSEEYADVVEHGGFVDKVEIEVKFGVGLGQLQGLLGYQPTVRPHALVEGGARLVVFVENSLNVHVCEMG